MPKQVITQYSCDAIEIWIEDCGRSVAVKITDRAKSKQYRVCQTHAMKYLGDMAEGPVTFEPCTVMEAITEPATSSLPSENSDKGILCRPCQKYFKAFTAHNRKVHGIFVRGKRNEDDPDQIAFAATPTPLAVGGTPKDPSEV